MLDISAMFAIICLIEILQIPFVLVIRDVTTLVTFQFSSNFIDYL